MRFLSKHGGFKKRVRKFKEKHSGASKVFAKMNVRPRRYVLDENGAPTSQNIGCIQGKDPLVPISCRVLYISNQPAQD